MPIITFVNSKKEETGKTLSLVAIATNMAIEYNTKILLISTTNRDDKINSSFIDTRIKKNITSTFLSGTMETNAIDLESGIEGLAKLSRSNRLTPGIIRDYTNIVFKDRLEFITAPKGHRMNDSETYEQFQKIITAANQYYEKVFIDLDNNISEIIRKKILEISDVIIISTTQRYQSIENIKNDEFNKKILNLNKSLLLIGKYDRFSKYNHKNVSRYLKQKKPVLTIPYNTLYCEASEEGKVADFFLKMKKVSDQNDRNFVFLSEVGRATETILDKIKDVQIKRIEGR